MAWLEGKFISPNCDYFHGQLRPLKWVFRGSDGLLENARVRMVGWCANRFLMVFGEQRCVTWAVA